jgi:hypothetical protein
MGREPLLDAFERALKVGLFIYFVKTEVGKHLFHLVLGLRRGRGIHADHVHIQDADSDLRLSLTRVRLAEPKAIQNDCHDQRFCSD